MGHSGLYAAGLLSRFFLCLLCGPSHRGNLGLYAVGRCLYLVVSDDSIIGCSVLAPSTYVLPRSVSELMS